MIYGTSTGAEDKLQRWYRATAFVTFNSIVFFVFVNLILYAILSVRNKPDSPLVRYGEDNILSAYPGWNAEDVQALLTETYADLKFEYEPFTGFRSRPLREKFINIDPAGFRFSKNQAPWPPHADAFNVFVFGGSTTFGMGLPDDETIASYLQIDAHRPIAVYNFGRIFYLSRQEEILFQQLLQEGLVPQVAIFIDGLNDFFYPDGEPGFSPRFRRFMAGEAESNPLDNVPVVKAAHGLKKSEPVQDATPATLENVATRWLANKRMIELIAAGFNVHPVFVWQPVPVYHYDLRYHFLSHSTFVRARGASMDHEALLENLWVHGKLGPVRIKNLADGYALTETLRAQGRLGANLLWLADMQQDKNQNLYVDAVHYSAAFSREIAERITDAIAEYR